jgi:hypothetical protein
VLVAGQQHLRHRQEGQAVIDNTKMTWIQYAEQQAGRQGELRSHRRLLIDLQGDACGELPEPIVTAVTRCEDLDRLRAAIRSTRTLTSLTQFRL